MQPLGVNPTRSWRESPESAEQELAWLEPAKR
jgi:hypothetical protein